MVLIALCKNYVRGHEACSVFETREEGGGEGGGGLLDIGSMSMHGVLSGQR